MLTNLFLKLVIGITVGLLSLASRAAPVR